MCVCVCVVIDGANARQGPCHSVCVCVRDCVCVRVCVCVCRLSLGIAKLALPSVRSTWGQR